MDKIILKGMEFDCRIGVSASERQQLKRIIVEVKLFLDLSTAAAKDDLAASVDYGEAYSEIRMVVTGKEHKLAETVAERISQRLLERFALKRVTVTVKKPAPLGQDGMQYAVVEIVRPKND